MNLNKPSSRPRRVLNDPSEDPNSPVPWPLTCTRMMTTTTIEITIWRIFNMVFDNWRSVFAYVQILFYRNRRRMLP